MVSIYNDITVHHIHWEKRENMMEGCKVSCVYQFLYLVHDVRNDWEIEWFRDFLIQRRKFPHDPHTFTIHSSFSLATFFLSRWEDRNLGLNQKALPSIYQFQTLVSLNGCVDTFKCHLFFHSTRPPKQNRFPCSKSPRRGLDNPSLVNCFTDVTGILGGSHPEGFYVIWWHQGNHPPGLPMIWWMILGRSHRHRLSRPIMFEWMWLQQKL